MLKGNTVSIARPARPSELGGGMLGLQQSRETMNAGRLGAPKNWDVRRAPGWTELGGVDGDRLVPVYE